MHTTYLKITKLTILAVLAVCIVVFTGVNPKISWKISAEPIGIVQSKPELATQTGHSKTVNAVVIDPNNQWIATGSTDNAVKIWEASTGRELRALHGHKGAVRALANNQDGKLLASGGNDKTVKIWDVKSGEELQNLTGHSGIVESLAFSADGRFLASGSNDKSIIIWDVATGTLITKLPENGSSVTSLAFHPAGSLLASGSSDQVVKIWDIAKAKEVRALKSTGTIKDLQYSADGERLAGSSTDSTIKVWKTSNGSELATLSSGSSKVLTLFFLDNRQLISGSDDRIIKIWDVEKRSEMKSLPVKTGNIDKIQSASISKDGGFLTVGNGDGTAAIFNVSNGEKIKTFENQTFAYRGLAFSSDGNWLAVGSLDRTIKLWDLKTGQSLPALIGHTGFITAIAFHPDNERVISASMDGTIRIWDIARGGTSQILTRQPKSIGAIAVSKNGKFIVSGSADQTVKLWDIETKSELYSFNDHKGEVTSVAFSPDGNTIASGSSDKTVKLWDVAAKKVLNTLDGYGEGVASIAFSPDGQLVASGGVDKTIKVREVSTGQIVNTFLEHTGKIHALTFSPDGNHLASASHDKTARIWSIKPGREEKVITGHTEPVYALSFSPDGQWLASGGDDGSIIISRKDTGENLATLISLRKNNDWLVATPQGFFDGTPGSWERLLWRFEKDTFNTKPVEVFFNEFFYPNLLAELLRGKHLPKTVDISKKDRRQPQLKIKRVDNETNAAPTLERYVKVKIEVAQSPADNEYQKGSGARDVRIFRNGSLVKLWTGDVLNGKGDKIELEASIPIVSGENQLTGYAFNDDNIKSSDAVLNIEGPESLRRKGILYIVGIAVGKNSDPEFSLSHIDIEAKEFAAQLYSKQTELNQFERIEIVPLINEIATKKNILLALKGLTDAGIEESSFPTPDFAKLRAVQPEDTVAVYFTGHGIAQNNRFYMLPHDLGKIDSSLSFNDKLKAILPRSISDIELHDALKDIDANRLLLVIDACNSGQVVETEETRQGPMNAKGLAQLAFDKGMFILTGSQSQENSYVSKSLKRSYLTYALVDDGLKSSAADLLPRDGILSLKEWFDYAVERVPQLIQKEQEPNSQNQNIKGIAEKKKAPQSQRPRAFYRRQMDLQPMIIAKVSANSN